MFNQIVAFALVQFISRSLIFTTNIKMISESYSKEFNEYDYKNCEEKNMTTCPMYKKSHVVKSTDIIKTDNNRVT